MNQRSILYLAAGVLVLALLYVFAIPGWESPPSSAGGKLFEGVEGQAIERIVIEQREEKLELVLQDGAWRLPSRNGFPADSSKIRALLLKIFDLDVSQAVPGGPEAFDQLGLSDQAVKRGFTKLSLFDAEGRLLAGVRIGEGRKSKGAPSGIFSGQYVRRDGVDKVYLVGAPLTVSASPQQWLELNLVNVLPANVHSVTHAQEAAEQQTVLFELVRAQTEGGNVVLPPMELRGGVPEGKVLQQPVVSQVRSGLENVRLFDVFDKSAEPVKNLAFDFVSLYKTTNGLSYRVETAQKDERYFAKLGVSFDERLAQELKAAAEKAAATAAASPTPSAEPSPAAAPSASAAPTSTPEQKKPELKLSSAAEADGLNKQFSAWVYELPGYQAKKLRYTKAELTEPPALPKPAEGEQPQPGAVPQDGVPPGFHPPH